MKKPARGYKEKEKKLGIGKDRKRGEHGRHKTASRGWKQWLPQKKSINIL